MDLLLCASTCVVIYMSSVCRFWYLQVPNGESWYQNAGENFERPET